jgi:hypothetical protein
MEVSEDLLHGLHVGVHGGCLGGAKDAQRRGYTGARADGRVLQTAQEDELDVLGNPGRGG